MGVIWRPGKVWGHTSSPHNGRTSASGGVGAVGGYGSPATVQVNISGHHVAAKSCGRWCTQVCFHLTVFIFLKENTVSYIWDERIHAKNAIRNPFGVPSLWQQQSAPVKAAHQNSSISPNQCSPSFLAAPPLLPHAPWFQL